MAAGWQIQGRDAFSATSGTGAVYTSPINIGAGTATAPSGFFGSIGLSPVMAVLLAGVGFALFVAFKRRKG